MEKQGPTNLYLNVSLKCILQVLHSTNTGLVNCEGEGAN